MRTTFAVDWVREAPTRESPRLTRGRTNLFNTSLLWGISLSLSQDDSPSSASTSAANQLVQLRHLRT